MAAAFQPYVGPRPFEPTNEDRNRYFGRDDEAGDLLSCVIAHSSVLLYAPSGAGKTSLINAKLTPMLEKAGFEVLKPSRVGNVLPDGSAPGQISNIYTFNVLRNWDEGSTNPSRLARESLSAFLEDHKSVVVNDEDPKPRVAIFDQFEELFTSYQERPRDREDFFDQVGAALENDRLLRVIFAMREDYIAELDPYLSLLPEKLRTRYRIERLSEDDALLAITEPLKDTEYSYAEGVAEQLVENLLMVPIETANGVEKVRGDSVDPVQLQVVCQTLWDNCQQSWGKASGEKRVITRKYLEEFGDVDQALSGFYEKAIKQVVEALPIKEGVLRRWFEQNLITSAGTRGTVFRGSGETGKISNDVVDKLVNQHIIRAELRGGSKWYELTHDRFIAPIKASNERWFLKHSGGAQTPKRLEARAEQWASDGRQRKDLIANEGELLEAERWLDSAAASDIGYTDTLLAFVQASRAAKNEEQAKSARRLKLLVAALAVMVILLIGASVVAFISLRSAQKRERDAIDASKLADQRKSEAEAQRISADLQARQLEIANIIIQWKQAVAEQETKRASKEAGIARLSEAKALRAEKKLRAFYAKKNPLDAKKNEADRLFYSADSMSFEQAKQTLQSALSLYEEVIIGYKGIGENTEELEARKREIEQRLRRK